MTDSQFGTSESVVALRLSSVMCAPLVAQGHVTGAMYVGNDRVKGLFERSQLDVLTIFAGQASLILQNAMLLSALRADKEKLAAELKDKRFGEIIGVCPSMMEVFRKLQKVSTTDISVLITGETGTGKELIAREIHRRSNRSTGPFIVINCGAIPENLIESELFGHVKGAFTGAIASRPGKFQAADKGTLFLDEIGELPLNLQVKLLRALQERIVFRVGDSRPEKVDIRVVAATNRVLEEEIRTGRFREDLYYRLNVVNVWLPPLRERGDDVLIIAKALLSKYADELKSTVQGFTAGARRNQEVRVARQHPAGREPHQEGARPLREVAPRSRGSRPRRERRHPDPPAREGERRVPEEIRARGARTKQRQSDPDRSGPGRRPAHHLSLPGA